MAQNIKVEELLRTPIEKQQIELVERKGIGHPDSISDGLAEDVSRALCREYISKCGAVLHHNTDETQIVAGRSCPKFGGGSTATNIYFIGGQSYKRVRKYRTCYRICSSSSCKEIS